MASVSCNATLAPWAAGGAGIPTDCPLDPHARFRGISRKNGRAWEAKPQGRGSIHLDTYRIGGHALRVMRGDGRQSHKEGAGSTGSLTHTGSVATRSESCAAMGALCSPS